MAARAEPEQRTRRPRECRLHHGCKSRTMMLKGCWKRTRLWAGVPLCGVSCDSRMSQGRRHAQRVWRQARVCSALARRPRACKLTRQIVWARRRRGHTPHCVAGQWHKTCLVATCSRRYLSCRQHTAATCTRPRCGPLLPRRSCRVPTDECAGRRDQERLAMSKGAVTGCCRHGERQVIR